MNVIQEEFIRINLWCRPLARKTYTFSDMKRGKAKNLGAATGTLLSVARERASGVLEQEHASGILEEPKGAEVLKPVILSEEDREIAEARARLEGDNKIDDSAPRLRRLKAKIDSKLFDYSELEREKVEEEIDNLVNKDHYYDEIEPIDADEIYKEEIEISPIVIVLGIVILVTAGIMIWRLSSM